MKKRIKSIYILLNAVKSHVLLTLFFILCFIGCSTFGKIIVTQDAFTNKATISVKMQHKSIEKFDSNNQSIAEIDYIKEIEQKKTKNFIILITVKGSPIESGVNLDNKALFILDDENTNLTLIDLDNFPESSKSKETKTENSAIYVASGEAMLNPNLLEKILDSNKLSIQIYYKSKPITYLIERNDLEIIKDFAEQQN